MVMRSLTNFKQPFLKQFVDLKGNDRKNAIREIIRIKNSVIDLPPDILKKTEEKRQMGFTISEEIKELKPIDGDGVLELKEVMNIREFMRLVELIIDKDSPYGDERSANWASEEIERKIERKQKRCDQTAKELGYDHPLSLSLKDVTIAMRAAYAKTLTSSKKLSLPQLHYKALSENISYNHAAQKKRLNFLEKTITNFLLPGGTILIAVGAVVTKYWGNLVEWTKSLVPPQKQTLLDLIEVASNIIGPGLALAATYFSRKAIANKFNKKKQAVDKNEYEEKQSLEEERLAMVKREKNGVRKELKDVYSSN